MPRLRNRDESRPAVLTTQELGGYSRELLLSLKRIANANGLALLAHLLSIAAVEAGRIAEEPTLADPGS